MRLNGKDSKLTWKFKKKWYYVKTTKKELKEYLLPMTMEEVTQKDLEFIL